MFAFPITGRPLGYQQIAAATLVAATNLTPPPGTKLAYITSDTSTVRWRDDGIAPTTAVGMLVAAGDGFIYAADFSKVQFIAAAGSPILSVSYYG